MSSKTSIRVSAGAIVVKEQAFSAFFASLRELLSSMHTSILCVHRVSAWAIVIKEQASSAFIASLRELLSSKNKHSLRSSRLCVSYCLQRTSILCVLRVSAGAIVIKEQAISAFIASLRELLSSKNKHSLRSSRLCEILPCRLVDLLSCCLEKTVLKPLCFSPDFWILWYFFIQIAPKTEQKRRKKAKKRNKITEIRIFFIV